MILNCDTREVGYTTAQVLRLVPVSARQLQWWDEQQIVSPPHQGHSRMYGPVELFGVLLIHELRMRGFTLRQIRNVRRGLVKQQLQIPTDQQRWLLTDGTRVVLLEHPDVVIAFLEQRRSPAFVLISLAALVKKVEEGRDRFCVPAKREPQSEVRVSVARELRA